MTNEEFGAWVDDEGGPWGLFLHGLNGEKPDDPVVADLWGVISYHFGEAEYAWRELAQRIGY